MKRFHFHPPKPSSSGGPVRAEQAVGPPSPIHAPDRGFRLSVPWQSSALISRQIQSSSSKKANTTDQCDGPYAQPQRKSSPNVRHGMDILRHGTTRGASLFCLKIEGQQI